MLRELTSLSKHLRGKQVTISSNTFRLVSRFNFTLLISLVVLMTAKVYFGDPIICAADDKAPKLMIDNFCWLMGVYIQKGFVGTLTSNTSTHQAYGMVAPGTPKQFLRYYQWLVFVYFWMAISYMVPWFLWKTWEGGLMLGLCKDLQDPVHEKYWTKEKRNQVLSYFIHMRRSSRHAYYAFRYFVCQTVMLLVCIFNIVLVESLFGGFWERYYSAIGALYPFDYDKWTTETSQVFPRIAKCDFYSYGPSGSTQMRDALCMLPLNIINEKIFAFFFFWLLIVAILTTLDIIYGIIVMNSRYIRIRKIAAMTFDYNYDTVNRASDYGARGEFFVLYLVGKNISPYVFNDLIVELANTQRFKLLPEADV